MGGRCPLNRHAADEVTHRRPQQQHAQRPSPHNPAHLDDGAHNVEQAAQLDAEGATESAHGPAADEAADHHGGVEHEGVDGQVIAGVLRSRVREGEGPGGWEGWSIVRISMCCSSFQCVWRPDVCPHMSKRSRRAKASRVMAQPPHLTHLAVGALVATLEVGVEPLEERLL